MGATGAVTDFHNAANYVGKVFEISGERNYAFLKDLAGGDWGYGNGMILPKNFLSINQFDFALASPWSHDAGSQPDIDELDARVAPTGTTFVRGQDLNTIQIFQEGVDVSYKKQSAIGQLKQAALADPITALAATGQPDQVSNELQFQINAHVNQVAVDAAYTFLNGTFATSTATATSAQVRGVITGTSTNAVAAGSANLTKAHINSAIKSMVEAGAPCIDLCIYTAAFHVQELDALYSLQERNDMKGGTSLNEVLLPLLGKYIPVKHDIQVPAGSLAIIDRAFCAPIGCPVSGKGYLFYEPIGKLGAVDAGMIYGQMGIDYGPEEYHAKVTGLATS